jgi:hypothetical protein
MFFGCVLIYKHMFVFFEFLVAFFLSVITFVISMKIEFNKSQ